MLIFNLLHITYREGLVLVDVMPPTSVTYCFVMVPPVLAYVMQLLAYVVGCVTLLFPGLMLGLYLQVA